VSNVTDVVRLVNIVLAVWLVYVSAFRTVRDWPVFSHRARVVRVHLLLYLLVTAYGSLESLAMGSPPGLRIYLLLAVNVSLLLAQWRTWHLPADHAADRH